MYLRRDTNKRLVDRGTVRTTIAEKQYLYTPLYMIIPFGQGKRKGDGRAVPPISLPDYTG
jgi:hypothetical protein